MKEELKPEFALQNRQQIKKLNEDFKAFTGRDFLVGDLYVELNSRGEPRNFFMEELKEI